MYKVIKLFADLKDGNHIYNIGDTYPREGILENEERIKELSGSSNKQGEPLIGEMEAAFDAAEPDEKSERFTEPAMGETAKPNLNIEQEEKRADAKEDVCVEEQAPLSENAITEKPITEKRKNAKKAGK